MKRMIVGGVLIFVLCLTASSQERRENDCATDSQTRIYSNATYIEEAGDVIGLEMALKPMLGEKVDVLLYVYEGAPTTNGMSLTGFVEGKTLVIDDTASEHVLDSAGKDAQIAGQIIGTWDEKEFAGTVQINGANPETVEMRRVAAIWLCTSNRESAARAGGR